MITRIYRFITLLTLIIVSGWLSLKLAVPPGYASPIWPPAGIALGGLLLWGNRYWPAIWIGAFLINFLAGSNLGATASNDAILLSAAGIASGSTLQGLCAAWLAHRLKGPAIPKLDAPRNILLFFSLCGPLACVIAPTFGVASLLAAGIMPASTATFSWWNWWIGDSLGVIILTPILFCLFAQPRKFWAPRRISVAAPQLILLAALISIFVFVFRDEQSHIQMEFDNRASEIDKVLSERLNQIINGSVALRDLHNASTHVTRKDFADFSKGVLERYPEIQVLEWLPLVPREELRQFEKSVRAEGYANFMVTERAPDGSMIAVRDRPEYFPILFIEPFQGNEKAFGFDSASTRLSWMPKALARASGKPTVSQKLKLVQDTGDEFGVLISTPVYQRGQTASPSHLTGFVAGIFRPKYLLSKALEGMNPEQFGISLLDLNAPTTENDLFTLPVKHPLAQGEGVHAWQHTMLFGDREWQLIVSPDRSFILGHGSSLAWITLTGGLIFTAMLNIYLLTITGQTAHVRNLVEKRTHEVRSSERRLRFLLETSPIAVRIARKGGHEVIFANPKYDELIMTEPGHALRINPSNYYADPEQYEEILRELAHGHRVENRLIELAIPEKANKWVLASYLPIEYEGEEAIIGWFYDITERMKSEEKLVLAARVFSEAHEGITITDAEGYIVDVNPTFCEITGYSREDVIGKTPALLKSGKHPDEFYSSMWKDLTNNGLWHGEVWNRKKSGELYAELLTISALRDENGKILHYVGLFSDITHSKQQQQTLEMMAHYDVLTQLPNRVLFADRFNQAIAHCKRESGMLLAVCYLDLDGFKQVNDSLGHEAGDLLLVQVAERIKSLLREEDTVSRLGGDEFSLLLGDIKSLEQCEQALERIHRSIAQPYLIGNQSISIGASSGVTIYPLDNADPDTLLRHADQAMYQAKLSGRNCFHLFDAEHDQQIQKHRLQLEAIEQAFERKEFHLFYQPKVNMRTGKVFGAEALIRWIHPERGIVPPSDFLPMIEGTTFEVTLGNWVIDQAMNQIEQWNAAGLDLQISVNISPRHLQWHGFFANLDAALSKHPEMPSRQFELEVLESSVVEDLTTVSEVLRSCSDALGVNIALDDFGTGYSSLTHLRHLPANIIKIDQSFVRDMLDDPDDYAIIEGVVGLSSAFRRSVIAEGVESAEHGVILLNMGCNLAQGYGIARPMPAEELPAWIAQYRPDQAWERFVRQPLSHKQALELSLNLESAQWIRRIIESLHSAPGTHPRWPIMNPAKCHCGRWLAQARSEGLYDEAFLERFNEAHENLHQIGHRLMYRYLEGRINEAIAGLPALQAAYETLIKLFEDQPAPNN